MVRYVVEKIENGIATIRYSDNSWAEIILSDGMTEEQLDEEAWKFRPKAGAKQHNISVGASRQALTTGSQDVDAVGGMTIVNAPWLTRRIAAYGTLESQIEFIVENGLEAWQEEVRAIKERFPKSPE